MCKIEGFLIKNCFYHLRINSLLFLEIGIVEETVMAVPHPQHQPASFYIKPMALIANPNLLVFEHCLNLIHSHRESAHILCVIFTPSLSCMAGWLAGVGLFEGTSIISPASDSDLLRYTKRAEPLRLLFSSPMAHKIFPCSQRRKSEHSVYQGIVLV